MTPCNEHGTPRPQEHQPRSYVTQLCSPAPGPRGLHSLHSPVTEPGTRGMAAGPAPGSCAAPR